MRPERGLLLPLFIGLVACSEGAAVPPAASIPAGAEAAAQPKSARPSSTRNLSAELVGAAKGRTEFEVEYTPAYVSIDYPGGDVPEGTGVCTDVVIRAYRKLGIDLQERVHEDMARSFDEYPANWGLTKPDPNIDHRRVPNLTKFFARNGETKKRSEDAGDYAPGDIVTWNVGRNGKYVDHIGVVTDVLGAEGVLQVVHNIGAGPQMEDVLFRWPITGHFRYLPDA